MHTHTTQQWQEHGHASIGCFQEVSLFETCHCSPAGEMWRKEMDIMILFQSEKLWPCWRAARPVCPPVWLWWGWVSGPHTIDPSSDSRMEKGNNVVLLYVCSKCHFFIFGNFWRKKKSLPGHPQLTKTCLSWRFPRCITPTLTVLYILSFHISVSWQKHRFAICSD